MRAAISANSSLNVLLVHSVRSKYQDQANRTIAFSAIFNSVFDILICKHKQTYMGVIPKYKCDNWYNYYRLSMKFI